MRLWTNGSQDGCILLVGNQADIAPLLGISGDEVMLMRKQPIDELFDTWGYRPIRALVSLIRKAFVPEAFAPGAAQLVQPRGTWRAVDDQSYIFVVSDGYRHPVLVRSLIQQYNGVAQIVADRTNDHWVIR